MHVVTIAGIRPDFIRLSEVIHSLDASNCKHTLVHTGQHFDNKLSQVFFEELGIREPDYNLGCGGGDHIDQMVKLVPAMRDLLAKIVDIREPHIVVFLGDSNSVLVAPFLKKEGYKIAHIEALMRSHDMNMLEETNRICCDSVSDLLLTYNDSYLPHGDKFLGKKIVVGNTIVEPTAKHMPKLPLAGSHILVDIHRPENFKSEARMVRLFRTLRTLALKEEVLLLSFGRTMDAIKKYDIELGKIQAIPLMGYKDHLITQDASKYIISDSGTDQEQVALLGVPVFVPRDFTERPLSVSNSCSVMLDVKHLTDNMHEELSAMAATMKKRMRIGWLYPPKHRNQSTSEIIVESLLSDKKKRE